MSMFKGMFDKVGKAKKKTLIESVTLHKDVTPVLAPDVLLATEKRQQILQDIRSLLNLPDEEYDRVFLPVIDNFAAFVQNLPETERSYYASMGGMLEHGLERASLSLFLCRTYLLPEDATLASLSEDEMLWVYAVFTAALLYDVGKIATRHVITLTDEHGNAKHAWLPYSGSMIGQGTHYAFGFSEEHHDHMHNLVTPILARQIMPSENYFDEDTRHYGGFNWIASDPEVLESWLAMFAGEQRQVGSLLTVIPIADAQLLESYFTDKKVFRHSLPPQTIAMLNKLNKQRKEFFQKLKELRDKMLTEHAERDNLKHTQEDKNNLTSPLEQNEALKKAKQSLFGFPSLAQEDRLARTMTQPRELSERHPATTARETAEHFARWMKDQFARGLLAFNHADGKIMLDGNKLMINQQLLQAYLADKTAVAPNLADLRQALLQTELMRTLSPGEAMTSALQVSSFSHVLVAQHPELVLPTGMAAMLGPAYMAQQQVVQTQAATFGDKLSGAQQQNQNQPPRTNPSPSPFPIGSPGKKT